MVQIFPILLYSFRPPSKTFCLRRKSLLSDQSKLLLEFEWLFSLSSPEDVILSREKAKSICILRIKKKRLANLVEPLRHLGQIPCQCYVKITILFLSHENIQVKQN